MSSTDTGKYVEGITHDMILSLIAAGVSFDELVVMYPDIDQAILKRTLKRALKKTPMFLDGPESSLN